jgi:hypothetical protein
MKTCRLAWSFVAACVLAPIPAQTTHSVAFTLLVQGAPSNVVNAPFLEAVMSEPDLAEQLQTALGGVFVAVEDTSQYLPDNPPAGMCQIHVTTQLSMRDDFTAAQRRGAIDTIVAHLRSRLDPLLYLEPRKHLEERTEQLRTRLTKLQAERAEHAADAETMGQSLAIAVAHMRSLEDQVLEARVEAAITERTQQQLEKLRAEHTARREELRQQAEGAQVERAASEVKLATVRAQLDELAVRGDTDKIRAELTPQRFTLQQVQAELRRLAMLVDERTELVGDVQRMLAVILEQLPANTVALQRARARIDVLAEERQQRDEALQRARAARVHEAEIAARIERLDIDLAVTKELLTEAEGQLARLQPVRYQLLRQRD